MANRAQKSAALMSLRNHAVNGRRPAHIPDEAFEWLIEELDALGEKITRDSTPMKKTKVAIDKVEGEYK